MLSISTLPSELLLMCLAYSETELPNACKLRRLNKRANQLWNSSLFELGGRDLHASTKLLTGPHEIHLVSLTLNPITQRL